MTIDLSMDFYEVVIMSEEMLRLLIKYALHDMSQKMPVNTKASV